MKSSLDGLCRQTADRTNADELQPADSSLPVSLLQEASSVSYFAAVCDC